MVALDDAGRVCVVRQYRHGVEDFLWEIPAGKLDAGEEPEVCAVRELREETGVTAGQWTPLGIYIPAPGIFTDLPDSGWRVVQHEGGGSTRFRQEVPLGDSEDLLFEVDESSASPGCEAEAGSKQSDTFKLMERRLLKAIMNPAMIVAWLAGLYLAWAGHWFSAGWLHGKLLLVVLMSGAHGFFSRCVKDFGADRNARTAHAHASDERDMQ